MTSTLTPTITTNLSRNVSTASTLLMPANGQRKSFLIQNVSAVNVGLAIADDTAAIGTAGTLTLVPNGQLSGEGKDCPKNGFNVIGASGTPAVTCWETV